MKMRFRFEKLEVWQEGRALNREVEVSKTPFKRPGIPALDSRS